MDFTLTDEQQLLVANVRELMQRENWEAYFAECDRSHTYPERWVKALCDLGFDLIMLPEEHGGLDLGLVTLTAVYEELGRWGAPTYVLYQLPCFDTILREGKPAQIDKVLAYVGTASRFGTRLALSPEPAPTSAACKPPNTRRDGKIYLNGHKTFITSSAHVPFLVVLARNSAQPDSFTEFFLDMSLPGVRVEPLDKLGLRMDSCSDVYFDEVETGRVRHLRHRRQWLPPRHQGLRLRALPGRRQRLRGSRCRLSRMPPATPTSGCSSASRSDGSSSTSSSSPRWPSSSTR